MFVANSEVTFQHLLGGPKENHSNFQAMIQTEYETGMLATWLWCLVGPVFLCVVCNCCVRTDIIWYTETGSQWWTVFYPFFLYYFIKVGLTADFSCSAELDNSLTGPRSPTVSLSHSGKSRMSCDTDRRLVATSYCAPYRMLKSFSLYLLNLTLIKG